MRHSLQQLMGKMIGILLLGIALLSTQKVLAAVPKIRASLVMPKTEYLVGEPIEVSFIARPVGKKKAELGDSDRYGQCSPYTVVVVPDSSSPKLSTDPRCASFFATEEVDCLIGGMALEPDKDTHQEVLLNYFYDFSKPGTYAVTVKRWIGRFKDFGRQHRHGREISAQFTIVIVPRTASYDLRPFFSRHIANLKSKDWMEQIEAAHVISFLPQPFLEPTLIQMLKSADVSYQGVEGLRRLNSAKARESLFAFLGNPGKDFSFEQDAALEALNEMGDSTYGIRLLELCRQSKNASNKARLLKVAARLDPVPSMLLIQPLLTSLVEQERQDGVEALAATERSEALPAIVKMLSDPSQLVRGSAASALVSLTRDSPAKDGMPWWSTDSAHELPYWTAWLRAHPDLPIQLMRECPQAQRR